MHVDRMLIGLFLAATLTLCGCDGSDDTTSEADATYEDMLSSYTLYSVADLWTAFTDGTSGISGKYILLQGTLHALSETDYTVTLIDSDDNTITGTFSTGTSLTNLQTALSNNSSGDADTVTIAGTCHFNTTDGYPTLDSCDYFYINDDE